MDIGDNYIKTIHLCSQPAGNRCRMFIMMLMDKLSAKSSILRFDKFPIEFFKIIHTLEQSHRVGMDFLYFLKFNTRINHQVLPDLKINLSYNMQTAFLKEVVIWKDASCIEFSNS